MIRTLLAVLWLIPPQDDREAIRRVHESVHKSFVAIEVALRKKTRLERADLEEETLDHEVQQILTLSENQQTFDAWGVAIDKDLILMADRGLAASDVEKIEITDATGARFGGKLHAVGRGHDFVLVKPDPPRELTPLRFGDWERPALGEYFHVTYADRVDDRWHLNVSPYIQTNAPLVESPDWFCVDVMRPGSVVSDKKGAAVGIALDQYLWVQADGRSSFLGRAIASDERLTDLEKKYESLRQGLPTFVKRVEILLRAEKGDEFRPVEDPKAGRLTVFGVTLDERGTLLVPQDLSRDTIRKIEDIKVIDGARRIPAVFLGAFRNFGGLIVRAEGLESRPGTAPDARPTPAGQLFFTASFDDKFGRTRTKLDYNRLFRREKGLRGVSRLHPRRHVRAGSFLLDFDGRVIGFSTVDKKEEDIDAVAMEASRERFYMDRYRAQQTPDYLRRLVFFSEVADVLADPAAHFDAKSVPMSKREEKKLVWLGVEYQELSKAIAEALGIQERDLTNDGRRGLVITTIYPDSPASKAGLQDDDVLLSIQPDGEPAARDFVAEQERFGFGRSGPYAMRGTAPWKPTRNYLTSMLTEIGADRNVSLRYLRAKKTAKVDLKLEYAPTDYETAERYKDDVIGITAKELTYEVRFFQKLEPGVSGVVVAKVESGGKADVAKLAALSIICRVNDVAVRDLTHFRELLAGSKSLTLTTVSYGQTRLIELARE